jgi:hypothetical protein
MHNIQVNRRDLLAQLIAAVAASALAGCATRVPAADLSRIKTIGVVSFGGSRLRMESVRLVASGIRTTTEIRDWGADALIVDEATKALTPRFSMVPVRYDGEALLADFTKMQLRDAVRGRVTAGMADAYLVISPIYQRDVLLIEPDPPASITLFDNRRVTGTTTTLTVNCDMTVFDGQTFEQIASRLVSFPIGSDTLEPKVGIVVESALWAEGYEMLTPDQKTKIQAILKVLIQSVIRATLAELGMVSRT